MSAADIQALLRFLTKEAKVPLGIAMGQIKAMQAAQLGTIDEIAKSNTTDLQTYFSNEKTVKQVLSAAKRASKKRTNDGEVELPTSSKRRRADPFEMPGSRPASEVEQSLELPASDLREEQLQKLVLKTNRAPVVLAFAVMLLKYTMPEQPLSSRLSLAQAVVSMNSQTKAKSIGLSTDKTAEEEGWGQGQPVIQVMNRDVSVLKRWGYEWKSATKEEAKEGEVKNEGLEFKGPKTDNQFQRPPQEDKPALWGIDLDQLKKLNGPLTFTATSTDTSGLPVYSPQSARGYLYRSFESAPSSEEVPAETETQKRPKKKTAAIAAAEREQNLGSLLKALDILYESWSHAISAEDLDKRAWSWYVRVRPEVDHGVAGWGAKGQLKIADILDLRRTP